MTTTKGLSPSFEFPISSHVLMQKAPRQGPLVSHLSPRRAKGGAPLDLVAGLVSVTMTCSVYLLAGLPLADGTGQALLSRRRERVNNDPPAQPSLCPAGLSVT